MMAKWKKKLTKKQLNHIKETTNNGLLQEFIRNRAGQLDERKRRKQSPAGNAGKSLTLRNGITHS